MTFSYNPTELGEFGLSRMRFELGDVAVLEPEKTAYLSDEEYLAVIESSSSWRQAKFRLVETLLRRFSYEVDTKIKEAEWKLSDRIDEWRRLYNQLKSELEAEEIASGFGFANKKTPPPIFFRGMNDWRQNHVWKN